MIIFKGFSVLFNSKFYIPGGGLFYRQPFMSWIGVDDNYLIDFALRKQFKR
jgi:hypothetical protein